MHVFTQQRLQSSVSCKWLKISACNRGSCHVQWLMFNIRELLCTYVLCVFTLSIFHSTLISLRVTQVHKLLIFDFHFPNEAGSAFCRNSLCHHHNMICSVSYKHREDVLEPKDMCSCGSVVEQCVSSAKVVGSIPREHMY